MASLPESASNSRQQGIQPAQGVADGPDSNKPELPKYIMRSGVKPYENQGKNKKLQGL